MTTPGNMILSGAGDPSGFSFRDTTPTASPSVPDPEKQFMAEWDAAQARYRAGVNAGYDPTEADQLYLAPVRNKWEVLKDVPAAMKTAAAKELDDAHRSFLVGVNSGYKAKDAENIYLKPAEQKWVAAGNMREPKPPSEASIRRQFEASPVMQGEEADALKQISSGMPERQAIEAHPTLLKTPGFAQRWTARYNQSVTRDEADQLRQQKAVEKEAAASTPEALTKELFSLAAGSKNLAGSPIIPFLQQRAGEIENKLTNAPAMFAPQPVSFSPPQEDLGGKATGAGQKYATKYRTAEEVRSAFKGKELSRDEAKKILADQFGIK